MLLGANCLAGMFLPTYTPVDASRLALDRVRAAGYAATEISHPGLLPPSAAPRVLEHARRIGLAIRSVHAPPPRRDPTLAPQRHAAVLAAELAAPLLVVHVSSLRFAAPEPAVRAAARERDLRRLDLLTAFCAPLGVTVALENGRHPAHPGYLFSILATLDGAASPAPFPPVPPSSDSSFAGSRPITPSAAPGLVFDSGHAAMRGGDPVAVARQMLPRLLHTHLHDNHGARDEHLVPGDGRIDWSALLRQLSDGGYRGALLLELRPRRGWGLADWEGDLTRARNFLSRPASSPKEGIER